MPSIVIIGTQWGDEGKGKLVDALSESSQYVVRFQGGNNAGHTLVVRGKKTKLQLTPCGILHTHTRCIIGAGVVANPHVLLAEIDALRSNGIEVTPGRLVIDRDCQLVMDYHPILDKALEAKRGNAKLGTTGLGIGPAYEDRVGRRGIRFGDLFDLDALKPRVAALIEEKNRILRHVLDSAEQVELASVWQSILKAAKELTPFVGNGSLTIDQALERGDRVVFEGAQAALLDVTFGTVPYVTSSSTLAGAASTGCGVGPNRLDHVLGVAKAYCTRVGSGPFPTEVEGDVGDQIRAQGVEFGTVTGRPRRCGWLDAVALRRAIRLNGCSSIALMKLDVLTGISPLKICTGYRLGSQMLEDFPALLTDLEKVEPQYIECPGWTEDITNARTISELPKSAQDYVALVQRSLGCPISLVSVGPDRAASMFTKEGRFLEQFSRGRRDSGVEQQSGEAAL